MLNDLYLDEYHPLNNQQLEHELEDGSWVQAMKKCVLIDGIKDHNYIIVAQMQPNQIHSNCLESNKNQLLLP